MATRTSAMVTRKVASHWSSARARWMPWRRRFKVSQNVLFTCDWWHSSWRHNLSKFIGCFCVYYQVLFMSAILVFYFHSLEVVWLYCDLHNVFHMCRSCVASHFLLRQNTSSDIWTSKRSMRRTAALRTLDGPLTVNQTGSTLTPNVPMTLVVSLPHCIDVWRHLVQTQRVLVVVVFLDFVVIHNGIITNYKDVKEFLVRRHFFFFF